MTKKEKFEKLTFFKPAFDKRNSDPKKDYGIGHVTCYMVLKGKKGAVTFTFSTGMLLPETVKEYIKDGRAEYKMLSSDSEYYLNKPMGYDVGYHSPKPMYKGQKLVWPTRMKKKNPNLPEPAMNATQEERLAWLKNITWVKKGKKPPVCEWLGVPCYCDGSALRAEEWFNIFLKEGSDKIWSMLEDEYKAVFK